MQAGKWVDEYVIPSVLVGTDETDLIENGVRTTRASEVDIQIADSDQAAQNFTVKIYGSCDNGVTWHQLYFYVGTANRWDPNAAVNSNAQVAGTTIMYTTDNIHDMLQVTGQRAEEDTELVTVLVRQKVAQF